MDKELSILDIAPKELTEVFEKVKTNLEIIKQLSEETNDLLKSVGASEILFQADINTADKSNCLHMWDRMLTDGERIVCVKCGFTSIDT